MYWKNPLGNPGLGVGLGHIAGGSPRESTESSLWKSFKIETSKKKKKQRKETSA